MAKGIVFIRSNHPNSEPRSKNILSALEEFHPKVIIWDRLNNESSPIDWCVLRRRAAYGPKMLFSLPIWWLFVWRQLFRLRPKIIHVCNIDSALPVYWFSVFTGTKYAYDIWDTAGGMFAGSNKLFDRLLNWVERVLIERSVAAFLPDLPRLRQLGYADSAPSKIVLLPNSQQFKSWRPKTLKFGRVPIRLLYTGVLARHIRGLEMLIETVNQTQGVELTIGGYGTDADYFYRLIKSAPSPRIRMIDKVAVVNLPELYQKTDFIVTLLDPTYPNYQYATSTKAYEAFANGLPIITTKDTATGNLVEQRKWGFVIPFSQASLRSLLKHLTTREQTLSINPGRVKDLDWRQSAKHLQELYRPMI